MLVFSRLERLVRRAVVIAVAGATLAGCAAADKSAATTASSSGSGGSMSSSGSGSTAGTGSSAGTGSMAGMNMGGGSTSVGMEVNGIKPIPTQLLAATTWEGMRITAQAMTAVPFVIYNGTSEQIVRPGPKTSFHLMVMLNDAHTGVPIPYAGVWATIRKAGKIVFDERQWPMISAFMGPHYGNNVSVPGAGTYQLSLLISPPVSARHVEYEHVWLQPHTVNLTFHWKPLS